MFIRRRKNKSGTTSVVVVDKSSGKFKELTTIGVSSSPEELDELERKARHWIGHHTGQLSLHGGGYISVSRALGGGTSLQIGKGTLEMRPMFHFKDTKHEIEEHSDVDKYHILYYQFIKHAFGLPYRDEFLDEDVNLRLLFDEIPDTREENDN